MCCSRLSLLCAHFVQNFVIYTKKMECEACIASNACINSTKRYTLHHGKYLLPKYLGLKVLTLQLPLMLKCLSVNRQATVVDVGAGIHGLEDKWLYSVKNLHEDDSDALWMLSVFKDQAFVHAFEANQHKAKQLIKVARRRPSTRMHTDRLFVHTTGVGGQQGKSNVAMCGGANTWAIKANRGAGKRRCAKGAAINVTTLDAFASRVDAPFYVKVDVEGGEIDVLDGMVHLLRNKQILLASFEYAVNWHPKFRLARPLDRSERILLGRSSLEDFQKTVYDMGYDTYLILNHNGVVLIPVYDSFWDDIFEICANRAQFYGHYAQWCWNDILIVKRCDRCVKNVLFNEMLPATRNKHWDPPLFECAC